MIDGFEYDVFLSHSTVDKSMVRALAYRLKQDHLKVWFDEWVLKPGDSIPSKIEEGLDRSRVLVLCLSANAFGSDWAQLESGTYRFRDPLNRNRRFIPLRLDDTPIKGSLAQFLQINWTQPHQEQEYAKLLEACRARPDQDAPAAEQISEPLTSHRARNWRLTIVAFFLIAGAIWSAKRITGNFSAPVAPEWLAIPSRSQGRYDFMSFSGSVGVIDTSGKVVISPRWSGVGSFSEGLAPVEKNGLCGYINTSGKVVIALQWQEAHAFVNGRARVRVHRDTGFIDTEGNEVIPVQWEDAADFSGHLARVKRGGKWGFVDTGGTAISPPAWDDAADFSEGMAVVRVAGKSGFINTRGKLILPLKWDDAHSFAEGLAPVMQNGTWGFIDPDGNVKLSFKWQDALPFDRGLARVRRDGKWGFIDINGNIKISPQWEKVSPFLEERASVQREGKWGFINTTGGIEVLPQWDEVDHFVGGLAAVSKMNSWGFVDRHGKIVVPTEWGMVYSQQFGDRAYRLLLKETGPYESLAMWLGPNLEEVWKKTLPFDYLN